MRSSTFCVRLPLAEELLGSVWAQQLQVVQGDGW